MHELAYRNGHLTLATVYPFYGLGSCDRELVTVDSYFT